VTLAPAVVRGFAHIGRVAIAGRAFTLIEVGHPAWGSPTAPGMGARPAVCGARGPVFARRIAPTGYPIVNYGWPGAGPLVAA